MEVIARIDYFLIKNFTQDEKLIKLWMTDTNNVQFVIEEVATVKELISRYGLLDKRLRPVDIEKKVCCIRLENHIYSFVKYLDEGGDKNGIR